MSAIIQINEVSKTYPGGIVAVDNLSLSVNEGEFVTFLGPSGCGKTTTLRMIAGFELPTSGRIMLAGEDVTDLPPYQRQVNTVFQDYALFPHMSISENVGYGLRVAGVPKPEIAGRVNDALARVGLLNKSDARPGNLSGGQKQRVALARALVRRPKVLLLDEPLSALDAKLREAMQVELKHLHKQLGITFVFVTHDQREALVMSDRVVVMNRGQISQAGTPAELYDRPLNPYVADFIGNSNKARGTVTEISGDHIAVDVNGRTVRGIDRSQTLTVGDKAMITVRPEKVRIVDPGNPPSGVSMLSGKVIDNLFHGSSCRIEIDVEGGTPFFVDVQLHQGVGDTAFVELGSEVGMALDPTTVSVFPDDGEPDQ